MDDDRPTSSEDRPTSSDGRPRLVVLGCGFGGYSLLRRLDREQWRATLITPRNYFLFTPLLPSAVTGSVEPRSIVEPARRRLAWVQVLEGTATEVDLARRLVSCHSDLTGERFEVPYDSLVISVGSAVADFGIPGVAEHALTLTSIEDARTIRRRLLEQFAAADLPDLTAGEIARRLTFVVCGAGPTGVEVAAEIDDLLDREVAGSYPRLAALARVVLLEAASRILRGFDEALADYARRHFHSEGIEVRLDTPVHAVEAGRVLLGEEREPLPCGLVVWAGGNAPVALVQALAESGAGLHAGGRLLVDDRLRVAGSEAVYALGDCATPDPPLPATAQVAQQQGKYLARALRELRRGREVPAFDVEKSGMLAYIGGGEALADLPQVKWSGRSAWIFWRSVYLTKLVSLANKVKVLFDWMKAKVFGRDLSRF